MVENHNSKIIQYLLCATKPLRGAPRYTRVNLAKVPCTVVMRVKEFRKVSISIFVQRDDFDSGKCTCLLIASTHTHESRISIPVPSTPREDLNIL